MSSSTADLPATDSTNSSRLRSRFSLPVLAILTVAVLKGWHRPIRWAATQMETDYSAGFTKRGLFGEILRRLHIDHYNQLLVISCVITAMLVAQLAWIALRRLQPLLTSPLVGAVLLSSFAFTYLVGLIGYLDLLQAVLTISVLALRRRILFLLAATLAIIFALFVHEMFLFVFVPVLALRAFLDSLEERTYGEMRLKQLAAPALLVGVAVLTTLMLALRPALSIANIAVLRQNLIRRLDFAPREWVFAVFARGLQ